MFSNILNETKGFEYQITVNILLKKHKLNGEIEFAPVYFNSTIETAINHRFKLENSFQNILYLIDVWINEGSSWIVESIKSQYINISTYKPLSGNSYISLPVELRSPKKDQSTSKIKIKNVFYGVMLGILILLKDIQEELQKKIKNLLSILLIQKKNTQEDKELISYLDYDEIEIPVQEKDFSKIEEKNNTCINVFGYENELVFPIYV